MILELLGAAKPPENHIAWEDFAEMNPDKWWQEDASKIAVAPVGASGPGKTIDIWFGTNRDGRPCAHGIIGAMTRMGKSTLFHVFISGLATRYGPEEINFYLVDGKLGVEFQYYRHLPHARVVALRSSAELSRSVLEEIITEMKRRNDAFNAAGVSDLPTYRSQGSPGGPMPRIVLVIDEYQEMFEDDRQGVASNSILRIAQQGASAGIHMLLGSQRFGAVGMLHQTAIFGNIHLRMAMKMSQSDIMGLTEFGRNGKQLIERCDLPGKIVINDQGGDDAKNVFGKVAKLDKSIVPSVVESLCQKADREWDPERRFATVVFDGQEQPNFVENPQLVDVVRLSRRPSPQQWQAIATAPPHERGLDVPDWFSGERPLALWLGQELNVHGQAHVVLRRRAMENILLVGDNTALYGMMAAMLASVPVNESPAAVRLWVADRAVPGTPWQPLLASVVNDFIQPFAYQVQFTDQAKAAMAWLTDWCAELDRRAALEEDEVISQPTWLMVLASADRLPALARGQNKFGSFEDTPEGLLLRRIYREGPVLGLHLILSFPSAGPLKQCMERAQMDSFKHRVATQMAEADSFLVLGKDHANKLQRDARPVFAIYQDSGGGTDTKFKPYTQDSQIPWPQQLSNLSTQLQHWK